MNKKVKKLQSVQGINPNKSNAKVFSDFQVSKLNDGVFKTSLSFENIFNAIYAVKEEIKDSIVSDEERDSILGAISSKFFEDIGWHNTGPQPIQLDENDIEINVDLDQVTLVIKNAEYDAVKNSTNPNPTLQDLYNLLTTEVFVKDQLPYTAVRLKKVDFLNKLTLKAGHTFMTQGERKKFGHVCHNFSEDIFKISIKMSKEKTDFREELWKDIVHVACWWDLDREDAPKRDKLVKSLESCPNYEHMIFGGPVFPLLVVLYKAVKCNERNEKIDIVLETYGGKTRAVYSTIDDIIAEKMLNSSSASTIIRKFGEKCQKWLYGKKTLILGVGACAWKKLDKRTYGVINFCIPPFQDSINKAKYFFEEPKLNEDDNRDESDENEHSDIQPDQPIILTKESLLIKAHKKDHFVPLLKKHKNFSTWSVYGKIIPIFMQPTTIKFPQEYEIINIQQYSWPARNAIGEKNTAPPHSQLAGHLLLDIHEENESSYFSFGHMHEKNKHFIESFSKNMQELKSEGNLARIEVAFKTESMDSEHLNKFLKKAIDTVIRYCKTGLKVYSVDTAVDIIDFVMKGHLYRINLLTDLFKTSNELECYDELPGILRFFASSASSFYSGRYLFTDVRSYLPKCAYLSNRPIFPKLSNLLYNLRENILNNCGWMSKFYSHLAYSKAFEIPSLIPVTYSRDMRFCQTKPAYSCDKCWKLFSSTKQINEFDKHNCVSETPGKKIVLTSRIFQDHHTHAIFNLSKRQKDAFANISMLNNSYNYFLTGAAGAGKSRICTALMEHFLIRDGINGVACLAQTKEAAINVNGVTINSFFDLGKNDFRLNDIKKMVQDLFKNKGDKASLLLMLKTLIIDEAGLLKALDLTCIDEFFKLLHNSNLPFGNVQVILIGDVLQLPPISSGKNISFFFQSDAFCKNSFRVVYLKDECHRQNDKQFMQILNRMRDGEVTDDDVTFVNRDFGTLVNRKYFGLARKAALDLCNRDYKQPITNQLHKCNNFVYKMNNYYEPRVALELLKPQSEQYASDFQDKIIIAKQEMIDTVPLVFSFENDESNAISELFMQSLTRNQTLITFKCSDNTVPPIGPYDLNLPNELQKFNQLICTETKLPTELVIAVGLQVQFKSNSIGTFVANNSLGTIMSIEDNSILVKPAAKEGIVTQLVEVRRIVKTFKYKDFEVSRTQFPLKLAYTTSVHAVEGLTLHKPTTALFNHLRLTKDGKFGAVYTGVSRMEDYKFIKFLFPVVKDDFVAHPRAIEFDKYHRFKEKEKIISDVDYIYNNGERIHNEFYKQCIKRYYTNAYVPTDEAKTFVENNLTVSYIEKTIETNKVSTPDADVIHNFDRDFYNETRRNKRGYSSNELINCASAPTCKMIKHTNYNQMRSENENDLNYFQKQNSNDDDNNNNNDKNNDKNNNNDHNDDNINDNNNDTNDNNINNNNNNNINNNINNNSNINSFITNNDIYNNINNNDDINNINNSFMKNNENNNNLNCLIGDNKRESFNVNLKTNIFRIPRLKNSLSVDINNKTVFRIKPLR
jgi:hypothetical protein